MKEKRAKKQAEPDRGMGLLPCLSYFHTSRDGS